MPTELPKTIRSYNDLVGQLKGRSKQASATPKSASEVPAAPETDPRDKGTAAIPKDPQAAPKVENLPANGTNSDQTPATTVTPDKKVVGEEQPKSATLGSKLQKLATSLNGLKKKATAAQISTNGSLPSDAGNDNKDSTPTSGAPQHAHSHGNADPNAKTSGKEVAAPADPAQKPAPTPPQDSKGQLPAEGKNTNDGKAVEKEKMASDAQLFQEVDPSFAIKVAHVMLATEEGRQLVQTQLEKAHGAEAAEDIIKAAMYMEKLASEQFEAQAEGEAAARQAWEQATPEQRAQMEKIASVHFQAQQQLASDLEKLAYDQGAADAATMSDNPAMMGEQLPPEQDGSQVSDEDIAQVLAHMVQSGQIDEATAQQIMQMVQGGGDDGGAGAAPAAGGAPAGGNATGDANAAPSGGSDEGSRASDDKKGDDTASKDASAQDPIKRASVLADQLIEELYAPAK